MRSVAVALGITFAVGNGTTALAWGEQGHQLVGSIAQSILDQPGHNKARQQVYSILHKLGKHTLSEAAAWPDCVRDVVKNGSEFKVHYDPPHSRTPNICKEAFPAGNTAEMQAMTMYAAKNWSQCDYHKDRPNSGECHKAFHFVDIPIQHGRYTEGDVSTGPHDIVAVIGDALYFLKNGNNGPQAAVVFTNSREALFVLAHLVGDLHQPLHVGSVYLDHKGNLIDPGSSEGSAQIRALAEKTTTTGGNAILDGKSQAEEKPNLHHDWDTVLGSLGETADASLVASAQTIPADSGDYRSWPAKWASETVLVAQVDAFKNLTYKPVGDNKWEFFAPSNYSERRKDIQEHQIKRAGVRLARLLAAIWPD